MDTSAYKQTLSNFKDKYRENSRNQIQVHGILLFLEDFLKHGITQDKIEKNIEAVMESLISIEEEKHKSKQYL